MNTQRLLAAEGSISSMSADGQGENVMQSSSSIPDIPKRKKKPGPKRDSKPAPNEKLERNRQAQRTHRERKEQYTKELEIELMRLKELFSQATRERESAIQSRDAAFLERDRLREENLRLKELRLKERIPPAATSSHAGTDSGYESMSWTCTATRTSSFSDAAAGFPSLTANAPLQEVASRTPLAADARPRSVWEAEESRGFASDGPMPDSQPESSAVQEDSVVASTSTELPDSGLDYDELGLDFILTLERPCMGHMQYLHVRAHNYQPSTNAEPAGAPLEVPDDGENQHISGHALMATAPLYSDIMERPTTRYPCQMPQIARQDLLNLLNLSAALEIPEPEIPPVRAWMKLMQDGRTKAFGARDFEVLKTTLLAKIHCYRFGAVVDAHDIDDALTQVCQVKEGAAVAAASPKPHLRNIEP